MRQSFLTMTAKEQANKEKKRQIGTLSESGENFGISMFEVRGSVLRGIDGNVSSNTICFLNLNSSHIFQSYFMHLEFIISISCHFLKCYLNTLLGEQCINRTKVNNYII